MIDETNARNWLRTEFDRCRPWIQAALDRDIVKTHSIADVWDLIASGKAQLWPLPNGVMVTDIEIYPQAKILRGWLAGGNLDEIANSEPRIRKWAEDLGCEAVIIIGREGFARVFGYERGPTIIVRKLDHG